MRLRPALTGYAFGLLLIRCASVLAPAGKRGEWRRDWCSELWHVRQSIVPDERISWAAERESARFCAGAFQDAFCLRQECRPRRESLATTMGSAGQCILFLGALIVFSFGVALSLPAVRNAMQPAHFRALRKLVLIEDARSPEAAVPAISEAQFETWKLRKQEIFSTFAFYRVEKQVTPGAPASLRLAHASSDLFAAFNFPLRYARKSREGDLRRPQLVLGEEVWRAAFGADVHIAGRLIRLGSREAVVEGVAPAEASRLPGGANAWLLEPDAELRSGGPGFVLARLKLPPAVNWGNEQGDEQENERGDDRWDMSAPRPDGSSGNFSCVSLAADRHSPGDIFLFTLFLACLALPATTSLPLGEYRVSAQKLSWRLRLRRWAFFAGKISLLLPIVYFLSLDLAYGRTLAGLHSSEYIQLVASFSICLFGLRWALRDQRQRCPVCLGKLTHPARVGQPSRSFLAWNGTELICVGGHGLLHVPEISTSWFGVQRWLYLDPSWDALFAKPSLSSASYF